MESPEKVEIFGTSQDHEIKKQYNNWMAENAGKIEIIERKFFPSYPGNQFCIAVFYREISA